MKKMYSNQSAQQVGFIYQIHIYHHFIINAKVSEIPNRQYRNIVV